MLTYILIGLFVLIVFGASGFRSAEKAVLMGYTYGEQDATVRMLKVQTIMQLDQVQDPVLHANVVNSVLKR